MKTVIQPATENRLLVALTAKKMVPCNSLAEASEIVRTYTSTNMPGMRRWAGGSVYHPTKKQVALISYNGKIWLKGLHAKGREMTSFFNGECWGKDCPAEVAKMTTDELLTHIKETPMFSVDHLCRALNCDKKQLSTQYRRNAEGLVEMADKAIRTGKKVGNYRAGELVHMAIKADRLAENAVR